MRETISLETGHFLKEIKLVHILGSSWWEVGLKSPDSGFLSVRGGLRPL